MVSQETKIESALFKPYRLLPPAQFLGFGHLSTLHRRFDCYGGTVARLQRRAYQLGILDN